MKLSFYKGKNINEYEVGSIYFDESTHTVKIAKSKTEADNYSGVQSATLNEDGTVDILNELGEKVTIDVTNLVSKEEISPIETAAYAAIPAGSLGTINGQSIESGNNISIDMSLFKVVNALPTENIIENKIYIVPKPLTENETEFAEYIYVNNKWDQLGVYKAAVDMSEYITVDDADERYVLKSNGNGAISISSTGSFNNYGPNAQAFNAVRAVTNYNGPTGSGYPLDAASFGVKMDGTTAFSHKKYDTFDSSTGAYTGAKNTAVLVFSGRSGLLYAKNTGAAADVTDAMYKRVGVIDSPDEEQKVYSAAQVDKLIQTLTSRISSLEERLAQLDTNN